MFMLFVSYYCVLKATEINGDIIHKYVILYYLTHMLTLTQHYNA